MLVVAGANDRLRFRNRFEQFILKMLGQTAGNDQFLALFRQAHQGAHRFLAGVLNEAAGVHHHHSRIVFVGADAIAGLRQQTHHVFGVHTVLFAAQVGERDRWFRRGACHHCAACHSSPYGEDCFRQN